MERPDPIAVRATALLVPWRACGPMACVLALLAMGAPRWTNGDLRAALLPGVPGLLFALWFSLGARPAARRVSMALATATAGSLALATTGSLRALGASEVPAAVWFQCACFASSAAFLALAVPAWRRVESEGTAADDELRMFEEL